MPFADESPVTYRDITGVMDAAGNVAGILWPALAVLSLILLFAACTEPVKGLRFWVPTVIVPGPVALIILHLVKRRCRNEILRDALTETLGNIVPVVISYTIGLSFLITRTFSGSVSQELQLLLLLVLGVMLLK